MKKYIIILITIAAPWYLGAQTLDIGTGANVTIGVVASVSYGTASSSGTITNAFNSGLVIESDANGTGSLIAGGSPNATVKRYVDKNAWHFVTPVTTGVTSNNFYLGAANRSWLSGYKEASDSYYYITKTDTALSAGTGFSFWVENGQGAQTIQYQGNITGADKTVGLTKSGNGWNLIGNPFPCALDWSSVSAGITTGTAYVWDNNSGGYKYSGSPGTLPGNIIPEGQGFFVQVSSAGNFTLPASARVHDHTNGFLKSVEKEDDSPNYFIRMDLDGGYYGNTVFVGFPENGSADFDIPGDATKLYSTKEDIQFFAVENEKELCVNANQPLSEGENKTVPLFIVQTKENSHTLVFSETDQLPNTAITLEDLKTGQTQDIRKNREYQFTTSSNEDAHRFNLHFAWDPNSINNVEDSASNMQIYSYGKEVYIRSANQAVNQSGEVFVYDMMGRKLSQQHINRGELTKITINTNNAYVVVKVIKEGLVKTEKVFIE